MTVRVRRGELADAPQIAECLAELGYSTPEKLVTEKLTALVDSPTDAVFVAAGPAGAELLGVISAHVLPLFHAPGNLARITVLSVRGEAQGRGAGRALVKAAEDFAWASGCRRVEVTSGDHRSGAHAFYKALGYAVDERRFLKHAPDAAPQPAPATLRETAG